SKTFPLPSLSFRLVRNRFTSFKRFTIHVSRFTVFNCFFLSSAVCSPPSSDRGCDLCVPAACAPCGLFLSAFPNHVCTVKIGRGHATASLFLLYLFDFSGAGNEDKGNRLYASIYDHVV